VFFCLFLIITVNAILFADKFFIQKWVHFIHEVIFTIHSWWRNLSWWLNTLLSGMQIAKSRRPLIHENLAFFLGLLHHLWGLTKRFNRLVSIVKMLRGVLVVALIFIICIRSLHKFLLWLHSFGLIYDLVRHINVRQGIRNLLNCFIIKS